MSEKNWQIYEVRRASVPDLEGNEQNWQIKRFKSNSGRSGEKQAINVCEFRGRWVGAANIHYII